MRGRRRIRGEEGCDLMHGWMDGWMDVGRSEDRDKVGEGEEREVGGETKCVSAESRLDHVTADHAADHALITRLITGLITRLITRYVVQIA